MLESLFGLHGLAGLPFTPPGLGEPLGSHITMPSQNAGCNSKPKVPPLPFCLGRVGGSVGSVRFQLTLLPAPGLFE